MICMEKRKKIFLEKCRYPELARRVLDQMGESWNNIIKYPEDFRDAGAGVSGFVYYSDTVPFSKRNLVLIMNALNDFENEIGSPLNKPTDDETAFYNWLAWFALENTIQEIIDFKEGCF